MAITAAAEANSASLVLRRGLAVWSMKKDPDLESALSRNRRWIVNNQIKNFLLRSSSPSGTTSVRSLQKRFKSLDLRGRAINWLRKYPCCFDTFSGAGDPRFSLSKRMSALVDEEHAVLSSQEPAMARRLSKLLMLSRSRRLSVSKLDGIRRSFGFPDDYLLRILPSFPETFRIWNPTGRRESIEVELLRWDPDLAVSAVELKAAPPLVPRFECSLPATWIKTVARFQEFNEGSTYLSPYQEDAAAPAMEEKRAVGMVHELLSLTLWKKLSVVKLQHFCREFGLPERLNVMLLRHPCVFYVSNRYRIYTVVLREGYVGSELAEKDPLVVVKEKFGELMQEGLHEYNQRRRMANLEKKRKKGVVAAPKGEKMEGEEHNEEDWMKKAEERKRFYKVLFDENP